MLRPPDDLTYSSMADWVEMTILTLDDEPFRVSDAEIADAIDEYGGDAENDFAALKTEMDRRASLALFNYPIARDGQGYSRVASTEQAALYYFLLCVSLNQHYAEMRYTSGQLRGAGEIFENVVEAALNRYVGGNVMRVGAPRRNPVPSAFPKAVEYLAKMTGEEFGYGKLEKQATGDDGLDVIAWKAHADQRPSQLVVLAQCAIGTDWAKKRSELDLDIWRDHVRWHSKPIKAFAVPFFIETGGTWRETAVRGGVILDRGRICANIGDMPLPNELLARMKQWCVSRKPMLNRLSLN